MEFTRAQKRIAAIALIGYGLVELASGIFEVIGSRILSRYEWGAEIFKIVIGSFAMFCGIRLGQVLLRTRE